MAFYFLQKMLPFRCSLWYFLAVKRKISIRLKSLCGMRQATTVNLALKEPQNYVKFKLKTKIKLLLDMCVCIYKYVCRLKISL